MFFIIGVSDKRKELEFAQSILCRACGNYGRYSVFMIYTVLSLFFIPTIKWNRRYYVQTSCCGRIYELDPQIGKRIERGERVDIVDDDLNDSGRRDRVYKTCRNCGYSTDEDFDFCPKCGERL